MEYVALQVKTNYSLLQSLNDIKKLVSHAKSLGYKALAITDTNNMFGVPEFYNMCKENGIKPIIGLELEVDNKKILLYAMNNRLNSIFFTHIIKFRYTKHIICICNC